MNTQKHPRGRLRKVSGGAIHEAQAMSRSVAEVSPAQTIKQRRANHGGTQ